jgi:hypothetical protein
MGAGTGVLVFIGFLGGVTLGRGDAPPRDVAIDAAAPSDDGALVELLARVGASRRAHGGVEDLTFPDALMGQAAALSDEPAPQPAEPVMVLEAGAGLVAPVSDPQPTGRYTIEAGRSSSASEAAVLRDGLRAAGLPAWMEAERVAGQLGYRVAVGGWDDEAQAAATLIEMTPALTGAGAGSPAVVPVR